LIKKELMLIGLDESCVRKLEEIIESQINGLLMKIDEGKESQAEKGFNSSNK
jgi:hypothetical protein